MKEMAFLIGGILVAVVVGVMWFRATRRPPTPLDPIAATTGSNRTLTGNRPAAAVAAFDWDEALRRLVAYALDDAPREALSRAPDPTHAPVFQAVQKILERIDAQPRYIPRRPSLLPKLMATVADGDASMMEVARIVERVGH